MYAYILYILLYFIEFYYNKKNNKLSYFRYLNFFFKKSLYSLRYENIFEVFTSYTNIPIQRLSGVVHSLRFKYIYTRENTMNT